MRINGLFLISLIFLLSSCDTEITDPSVGEKAFFKFYGAEFSDEGYDVVQTDDKGYIIAGSTTSASGGENSDMFLVKTDSRGMAVWKKHYGGPADDAARRIKKTPDGAFIVVGDYTISRSDTLNREIAVLKIDREGNQLWMRTFGYVSGSMSFDDEGSDVAVAANGNLLIIGTTILNQADSEVIFVHTSPDGIQIGQPTLIGQNGAIEAATTVLPDPTGKYLAYFAGYTNYSEHPDQSGFNVFLGNISKEGNVPFPNIIGGYANEFAEDMTIADDHKLIILGTETSGSSSRIFIKKVNLDLDVEWTIFPEIDERFNLKGKRIVGIDGGYYLLANRRVSAINTDLFLHRIDQAGNSVWERPKTYGGEFKDIGNSLVADDQGITVTGSCGFSAIDNNLKIYLIRTGTDGELK